MVSRLDHHLRSHPDRAFVNFLIHGFSQGFSIGYVGPDTPGQQRNLLSARQNFQPVNEAICKELVRGHTSGPFDKPPLVHLHCSPLGAVLKKDGTYRIILDLSSPHDGTSINDGIPSETYSVKYSSFDEAVCLIRRVGRGCFLAKLDIKHAFRLCPVHPSDWQYLGYFWNNQFFVDTRLPFGSRSSPYIFNQFAEALAWILIYICGIQNVIHYLDDFLLCGSDLEACKDNVASMQTLFTELGVPLAPEKTFGPSTTITYLGIEIDSVEQVIRLPDNKLSELIILLRWWSQRRKCTKRELLSLIGSLSFACKVVKPGRIFLRRLIDLSTTVDRLHHHICLNSEARLDIAWWIKFIETWNGKEFIQSEIVTSHTLELFTDASNIGFGALYGSHWFSVEWPERFHNHHINYKELFAIVAAVFTWGLEWQNKQVLFYTDNMIIANVWRSGSCRSKDIMSLIRPLFMFSSRLNINILMKHIPGCSNILADALSRSQVTLFKQLHRRADIEPTPVSADVWHL